MNLTKKEIPIKRLKHPADIAGWHTERVQCCAYVDLGRHHTHTLSYFHEKIVWQVDVEVYFCNSSHIALWALHVWFPNKSDLTNKSNFLNKTLLKKDRKKRGSSSRQRQVDQQWKTCAGIRMKSKNEAEERYFCRCRIYTLVFGVLRGNSSSNSHSTHKHVWREHTHWHTHTISSNSALMWCQGWTFHPPPFCSNFFFLCLSHYPLIRTHTHKHTPSVHIVHWRNALPYFPPFF
jgi:hypothetical protein